MKTTTNYGLKKPDGTDLVDIEQLNYNADVVDGKLKEVNTNKADKTLATTAANGLMSAADKVKLNGIAVGADKTLIANNLTTTTVGSALDAVQGKKLNDGITAVNTGLNAETQARDKAVLAEATARQGADAQLQAEINGKLPLTGGVLSGRLGIVGPTTEFSITDTKTNFHSQLHQSGQSLILRNLKNVEEYTDIIIAPRTTPIASSVRLVLCGIGTYELYGEHNITVSQSPPATTLINGCMHNVY